MVKRKSVPQIHTGRRRVAVGGGSVAPARFPHYRLEESATGLSVAQTLAGYRLVPARDADTFPTSSAALIAAGAQALNVVRVDA